MKCPTMRCSEIEPQDTFSARGWIAVAGYSVLAAVMLIFLFFITAPSRETTRIVKRVNGFLQNVTAGNYRGAYEQLSEVSKKAYALNDFADDHKKKRIKFQNFIIHEVTFNKYDKRQAVAMVSSPFMLYGRETLNMEMIKEGGEWRIDFNRTIVNPNAPSQGKSRKKGGRLTNFLNELF